MIDFELMTIDRRGLSDTALFSVLQELAGKDNPMFKQTRRIIRSGNTAVTREIYLLKDGWSYND
jgi:hypothetical protein